MMKATTNPILCNPESGICEIPTANADTSYTATPENKPVKIIYFTDPICSSCWAIEPQLRKLKLEYGHAIEMEYHMGGLLPDWSYNSGGISKPSDVAHHWDDVSLHYLMPIDGDVWLEDPLHSSYPPSIAFKAAQLQDPQKAIIFLRIIREMVFLQKKNITKQKHLEEAAKLAGLNVQQFNHQYTHEAAGLFQQDLELAKKMGVRGFPSIFIYNSEGKSEFVYGSKPYSIYEVKLKELCPTITKNNYPLEWEFIFNKYPTLTTREFAELGDIPYSVAAIMLEQLSNDGKLLNQPTKNGSLWVLIH